MNSLSLKWAQNKIEPSLYRDILVSFWTKHQIFLSKKRLSLHFIKVHVNIYFFFKFTFKILFTYTTRLVGQNTKYPIKQVMSIEPCGHRKHMYICQKVIRVEHCFLDKYKILFMAKRNLSNLSIRSFSSIWIEMVNVNSFQNDKEISCLKDCKDWVRR